MALPTTQLFDAAAGKPKTPVPYRLPEEERERRQQMYAEHYERQIQNIHTYFRYKGFETAQAFFDVLLKHKNEEYNWRKDGYTPEIGHEIDLILARISAIENGLINVKAAEAKYGPIESAIISTIVHDLGEDFGLMPDDLKYEAHEALMARIGASISQRHNMIIHRGAQSMERLTHDRHYRIDDFVEKYGEAFLDEYRRPLDIQEPNEGDDITALDQDVQDFLWQKMDILPEHGNKRFQAFIMRDKKGKPRITVTRYGKKNAWGADWNGYLNNTGSDPYDADGKFSDSANGLTSRHAIESFTADGLNRYLRKRSQSFGLNDFGWRMRHQYPEMAKSFRSLEAMMGQAYTLARIMLNHYPDFNDPGESGFSASELSKDVDGVIHINPKTNFQFGFDAYASVPGLSHPIGRMMQQFRDIQTFFEQAEHPWADDMAELNDQFRRVMIKHGAAPCEKLGLNIVDLIDNPERYDPMAGLLEKVRYEYDPAAPEPR